MRLPNAVHESSPWRIREIAPDFIVEDVWALPVARRRRGLPGAARADGLLRPGQCGIAPDALPVASPRPPRRLVRPRQDLGPDATGRGGQLPIPGTNETSLTGRLPDDLRDTADGRAFRRPALRAPLSHRHRVRRRAVEPDRPRRDAPGLGRSGRRPLPGADGRLRQAARALSGRATWRSSSRSGTGSSTRR